MYALNSTIENCIMSTEMSFVCDQCGCVDNLRLVVFSNHGMRCSECETGQWHGFFEKEEYDAYRHRVCNRNNPHFGGDGESSFS